MPQVISGTPRASATHRRPWGPLGFLLSMVPPVALIAIGITTEGLAAIGWMGAILWGVVATIVFTLFSLMGKAMGMSRMDLLDLLGSAFVAPGTGASKMLGAIIHHMNGAILAVAWVYGAVLLDVKADWISAALWGVILWALALLMMSTIGSVHPAIRESRHEHVYPELLPPPEFATPSLSSAADILVQR